jgi:hypothetical protein
VVVGPIVKSSSSAFQRCLGGLQTRTCQRVPAEGLQVHAKRRSLVITNHAATSAQVLCSFKGGPGPPNIDVLQQVSAHQHTCTRSTNCLSQLTACRACLVGADTGAQAPAAKRSVESAEALSAAGTGTYSRCTGTFSRALFGCTGGDNCNLMCPYVCCVYCPDPVWIPSVHA